MIQAQDLIAIGTMRRPHGHRGEIQCQMQNDYWDQADPEFLFLQLDRLYVPFRVMDWRGKGADTLIFTLSGIESEPEAARLVGAPTFMRRADLTAEAEEQIAWSDLVGYRVIDRESGTLGTVAEVDEQTINTLLTLDDGRMMPIHEDFILSIDTRAHELHVNLPFELSSL
ncbi:MAG: 16S rRNA processing protein RimM [Paludibacteraceae bacterium]|nr:16S rRNA processing protein RimM [Paludibacteraceae bacterium]